MRRLPLTTRAFLYSFLPVCILLVASFFAIHAAVHQRVRQDLRDALQSSDDVLNRADAEFSRQNTALLAKLTDSAGLKASVGLLAEARGDSRAMGQVERTIEAQLAELRRASLYDLLAVSDLNGKAVATTAIPGSIGTVPSRMPAQSGLFDFAGELYQLQSVPIEIGGETAAVLTLGRRFDITHLLEDGKTVLLKDARVLRSTFPAAVTPQIESALEQNCERPSYSCEIRAGGEWYVISVLQQAQLGPGYALLGFRSLDAPLRAFNAAFVPILLQVSAGGMLFALISTLFTSRSVSRPLCDLAAQLQQSATTGIIPEKLDAGKGVREVDLVVNAFNGLADAERRSRSELIQATRAAQLSNQLKTEFLTNVSHELRTPLNGVLGMTDLLLETALSEEQREYAATARDSGRSLLALIDDVLDFSELETDRSDVHLGATELRRLIDDVVAATKRRAAMKQIRVESCYSEDVPERVLADESRVRRVLLHLCDNAVKFTESGYIRISVERADRMGSETHLKFSVQDTGIGIERDKLDLIFQQFTQADGSLTRRQGGAGIGLCIAKSTVALMKGTLGVESEPGAGSTFWFILPLALCAADEHPAQQQLVEARS